MKEKRKREELSKWRIVWWFLVRGTTFGLCIDVFILGMCRLFFIGTLISSIVSFLIGLFTAFNFTVSVAQYRRTVALISVIPTIFYSLYWMNYLVDYSTTSSSFSLAQFRWWLLIIPTIIFSFIAYLVSQGLIDVWLDNSDETHATPTT